MSIRELNAEIKKLCNQMAVLGLAHPEHAKLQALKNDLVRQRDALFRQEQFSSLNAQCATRIHNL